MEPVEEAGGGVAEGFEQAEEELIENASHGDGAGNPEADAIDNENVEARALDRRVRRAGRGRGRPEDR